jgi:hypothetical protein
MLNPGEQYRLRITIIRPDCPEEFVDDYYTLGQKQSGGVSVRILMPEQFELDEGDTLLFEFTPERVAERASE